MSLFYSEAGHSHSYDDLINEVANRKQYPYVVRHLDYYSIFMDIIISLVANKGLIIIDSDLSDEEYKNIGLDESILQKKVEVESKYIKDVNDILYHVKNVDKWELTLFTSGTTGVPKRITHNLKSITKAVKVSGQNSQDVWGFAYNPTHIAGIQVFFQALFNLNHIVRLFQLSKSEIFSAISNYSVTNLSATPTFYRLLLDPKNSFPSIKRITSGGEKFDENLRLPLQRMFPNAKILNVYASTEIGTLFASEGEIFTVKQHLQDFVKVVDEELYVAGEFVGKSEDIKLVGGWFKTGDRVEIIALDPLSIRFLGRVNESINVGGYKVFPTEVEELINSIPGVKRSLVYGKKNSVLGNIVLCDVERSDNSLTEPQILEFLGDKLQPFKIPRIIRFVDEIETTRTGKISRK